MKLDSLLFFVSLFFSLVWLLFKDVVSSNMMWVSFLRYAPILVLYVKYFKKGVSSFLPILFSLLLLFLSILGDFRYSFQGLLVMIMSPICLYVFINITFSRKQISVVVLLLLAAYLLYLIVSNTTQTYLNPNQVAFTYLILTVNLFICVYINNNRNSFFITLLLISIVSITLLLILYTRSRNSLIVLLLLCASFYFRKRVKHLVFIMCLLLIALVIYPWVYCQLAQNVVFRATQNTVFMDQDIFSGRQIIWSYVFEQLRNPSALCLGGINTEWWGKSMHNSAIDIVSKYGVISLVALDLIIIHYFKRICSAINNKHKSLLILVLVSMIWGFNESGLFLGTSFFVFLPYCIIHSKNERVRS